MDNDELENMAFQTAPQSTPVRRRRGVRKPPISKKHITSSSSSEAASSPSLSSSSSPDCTEDEESIDWEALSAKKKSCPQCGKTTFQNAFYGKSKQFCSWTCQELAKNKTTFKVNPRKRKAAHKRGPAPKPLKTAILGSFDWRTLLNKRNFVATPVQYFKHAQLSESWMEIMPGLKVEVLNNDWHKYEGELPKFYWIASVIKVAGYMALVHYEGCETNKYDFWINLCMGDVHEVSWCKNNECFLVPPKCLGKSQDNWEKYLQKSLIGTKTLPKNFTDMIAQCLSGNIQEGMILEVIDKTQIAYLKVAKVNKVLGGRIHLRYQGAERGDGGFWCHERSPLIHPIGWAQVMNHKLLASPDYPRKSFEKVLYQGFESTDAGWGLFMPVKNPDDRLEFKEGGKLEAMDPLNPSTICVSTVMKTLRNGYLMIGIDGVMAKDGSDWFCYHASSPYIFPVSFCESNGIKLTPPPEYKNTGFNWKTYLEKEKATAVPARCFIREAVNHQFKEGMHLEAVDIMDPNLICVASITRVVGRLLRIHFDGWEEDYDQWCDCESTELYPIGWCDMVGYRLEAPPVKAVNKDLKKKKPKFGSRGKENSILKKTFSPRNSILKKTFSPKKEVTPPKKLRKLSTSPKSGILKPSNSPGN